jgi:thermitase
MKKLLPASLAALVMVVGTLLGAAPGNAAPANAAPPDAHPGRILVKFRGEGSAAEVLRQHGLGDGPRAGDTGARVIMVPAGSEGRLIEALGRNPLVEYAEPDLQVRALTADTFFDRQYALHNTGQSFSNNNPAYPIITPAGTPDADVDAVEAWSVTAGSGIRVAVLDSGVDLDHEDISARVVARANFSGATTADDIYGHGTHMTGTVAAIANNNRGVSGVCPDCSILAGKVLNDSGVGSSSGLANGINWAVSNGAKVINMSLGVRTSRTLEAAVNNAWNKGVVLVAAAGNGGNQAQIYPAGYTNVIAVAATDNRDVKASFSTYGANWVDIAAPGVNVFSTFPNHPFTLEKPNNRARNYDVGNGTSVSSAIVSATAALAWSSNPGATAATVRARLESTADKISGTGTYWANGRVNADRAVRW